MTPAARISAAIEVLDRVIGGSPAEQALTGWARASRFAGSKDRAAVRDHVFDALRRLRSAGAMGGGQTGRAVMIGLLRQHGIDPATLFTSEGHAPVPLEPGEAVGREPAGAEVADLPDWLWDRFRADLGPEAEMAAQALRDRAPVFLRVNTARATRAEAAELLSVDGIETCPHPEAETALEVTRGARAIAASAAYGQGIVELQDASSQLAIASIPSLNGLTVLDYCAGGGGKSLALADRGARVDAWDVDAGRMRDIPPRAARSGARIDVLSRAPTRTYDVVLVDAPCSGSGTWRRTPDAKWRLTETRLAEYAAMQASILTQVRHLVRPGGLLVYATCSVLNVENSLQITDFVQEYPVWSRGSERRTMPSSQGDGFFYAHLKRA